MWTIVKTCAALALTSLVVACGGTSERVAALQPAVTLPYLNPRIPDPILPLGTTIKSLVEWQHLISQGKMVPENLVCMTQADSLEEASWKKNVARFNNEALRIIRFHEKMNAQTKIPSEETVPQTKK